MEINYIFPIGERCNSAHFLNKYNLRKMAYPLDWNRIDFETCCENISNLFENFLSDIVIFKKNDKKKILFKKKFDEIDSNLELFFNYENLYGWNNRNYNHVTFRLNQHFLPKKFPNNIYDWDRLCFLWNYDVENEEIKSKINMRINRFNKIYSNNNNKTLFLHISKIINNLNEDEQINYYNKIIKKYKLNESKFCIVLCCTSILESYSTISNNNLFIFLKVPSEEEQKILNNYIVNNNLYHANDIYNNLNDFNHDKFFEIDDKYIFSEINKTFSLKIIDIKIDEDELKH
jgi:hypothetical protein